MAVQKNMTIAFQGPLSGPEAVVGQSQLDAVKFAVHHFNEQYAESFKVSIVEIDDQGDPSIAQKLAPSIASNNNIIGLVGPSYSGATIASLPFYLPQNLSMISPSATRLSLTDPLQGRIGYPIFHRVTSTAKVQGSALYNLAIEGVMTPRVLIVDDLSAYAVGLSNDIRDSVLSKTIVGTDSLIQSKGFSTWGTDWASAVTKVKSLNVNVVIYTGYYSQAGAFFTHLRSNGYTGILAGGDGVFSNSIFQIGVPNVILEGVRISSPVAFLSDISTELENNFRKVIGRSSDIYAPESIDATNVLLHCIANGVTSRNEMSLCVDKFNGTSIYGHKFSFEVNGDVAPQNFYAFEIRSGAIRFKDESSRINQSVKAILESFPWYDTLNAKAAADAKAAVSKSIPKAAPKPSPKATVKKAQSKFITCRKGTQVRVFDGIKCPSGWIKK